MAMTPANRVEALQKDLDTAAAVFREWERHHPRRDYSPREAFYHGYLCALGWPPEGGIGSAKDA